MKSIEISEEDVTWDDPGEAQPIGEYDIVHDPKDKIPNARIFRLRGTCGALSASGFSVIDVMRPDEIHEAERFLRQEIMRRLQIKVRRTL
jgi:hypothetical protein